MKAFIFEDTKLNNIKRNHCGKRTFFDTGTRLAGTLDSLSTCPCRAGFIHSIPDSYGNDTYFADVAPQNFTRNAGTNSQSAQPSQGNSSEYSTSKLSDTHQSYD
ncbi:hypothetical protein [Xenorhabdus bovienii]|uniref:hypothetical protein n=1 Tax=Xenorhabdus bovienii TaxID=40576 RepID=UPI003DA2EB17